MRFDRISNKEKIGCNRFGGRRVKHVKETQENHQRVQNNIPHQRLY